MSVEGCLPSSCRKVALFFLVLFSVGSSAAEKPYAPERIPGAVSLTAEEVVELILSKPDLTIIDSRKKAEFAKGHIEGAVNLLNTGMSQEDLQKIAPDKLKPIIFYCNGDRCLRSSDAIQKAMEWGYQNIFWFRGGWKEWTEKRLPVITE